MGAFLAFRVMVGNGDSSASLSDITDRNVRGELLADEIIDALWPT